MEGLIPVAIIVCVLVFQVLAKLAQSQQDSRGSEEGWDDAGGWTPVDSPPARPQPTPARPGAPTRRPSPSPRVQQILEQLKEQMQAASAPPAPAGVPTTSVPVPVPAPGAKKVQKRTYLETASAPTPAPAAAEARPDAPVQKTEGELFRENIAVAFPKHAHSAPRTSGRNDRRIGLRVKGVSRLKEGILLAEVLGQPRAFDV